MGKINSRPYLGQDPTINIDKDKLPALQCTTIGPPLSEFKLLPFIVPKFDSPAQPAPLIIESPCCKRE